MLPESPAGARGRSDGWDRAGLSRSGPDRARRRATGCSRRAGRGRASGSARSASWRSAWASSRSTIRAALADLERGGVIRRTRGRGGGIFVAERKVERDLTSARRPARLPAPRRASSPTRGCCRPRPWRRTPTTAEALGLADGGAGARGRARAAGRRRADLARARAVPGRALPRPARPLARRLAVRAAAGALRARARRGGGAHRGRRRRRRRGAAARAAPRRAAAGGRPHGVGRRRAARSSARTTSSAPTARGWWSVPCHGRNQVVESRKS